MRKLDNAIANARKVHHEMSLPERLLWHELRARKGGAKIRRQHPVGPYVLDFYCAAAKLGFEIDGSANDLSDRPERDRSRDSALADLGIEIVRIPARDVLDDCRGVAEHIATYCQSRTR
ncbi:endonuclease domain-containing protein [Parerythrobacter aestuarii]|uniref:endonuclease domain-containing protein n=1 Tax=Parerythrobacter aestuarii TaxID=3020909 RepID=UPI0024DEF0EC|nr:endonuclease domain-containing protein [Parerythrobacter aestuarii]